MLTDLCPIVLSLELMSIRTAALLAIHPGTGMGAKKQFLCLVVVALIYSHCLNGFVPRVT